MQKDPNQTPAKANPVGSGQNPPKRTLQNAAAGTAKPTVPKKTGAAAGQSRPSAPIPQKTGSENMINVRRTLHRGGRSTIGYTQRAVVKIGKGIKKGVDIGVTGFNQYVETGETKSGFTARFTHFFRHITFSLFLTVFAVILLIALMLFSNTNIVVDEQKVTIPGASSDFEGFSILHLSDLHARTLHHDVQIDPAARQPNPLFAIRRIGVHRFHVPPSFFRNDFRSLFLKQRTHVLRRRRLRFETKSRFLAR